MMSDDQGVERIRREIADHSVVLFMKGTPVSPQCGFSAAVVQILTEVGVKFKSVDVLMEPDVREGISMAKLISYRLQTSRDTQEGLAAFMEKRKPEWQGR